MAKTGRSDELVTVIEPGGVWVRIPWREIVRYRDLLLLMVRRDFVSKYKQTVLGPLWFVITPILMTVVFTVVFGKVARLSTDGLPPVLFYLCGMTAWGYFASSMEATAVALKTNAGIYQKVYFPRLIIPLSIVTSNLMALAIQLVSFACFWIYFKAFTPVSSSLHVSIGILALPLLILQSAAIALGVGLWISALTTRYRDFLHLVGFLARLWMYATPVIYPLSSIPDRWRWVPALNPMTTVLEGYRLVLLGAGTLGLQQVLISVGTTVVLLVTGVLIFSRVERTFVDTI